MKRRAKKLKNDKTLTLVEHLAELRRRIIYSALVLIVAVGFCYSYVEIAINDVIDIADNIDFVFIAPAELLMSYIKLSLIGGLIVASPFLIFQIWLFVIPGMSGREKRYIFFSLLLGSLFFIAGTAFAYFIVIPTMIVFFMGFQMEAIQPMISFDSYLSFVLSTLFTFGAVFELPILMVLLSRFGILKVSFLKKNRKYIILIIFILAAILTPPDVISQIILAGPMILLSEIGIFLASIVAKKEVNDETDNNGSDEQKV